MDKSDISHHISQRYNEELEDVRNRVLAMGGLVEQQLANAIEAIVAGNREQAELVITNDIKVNAFEVAIDEECTQILARRQPAASDLRLLMTVIKTITDLERIGDETAKVARMALHLIDIDGPKDHFSQVENLGNHVRKMLHDTLDAFARTDVAAAVAVAHEDIKIDREYDALMRQLITFMMEDPRYIRRELDMIWMARALERIGDHSRNICEYVIYMVKGKDVRHTSIEQIEEELKKGFTR